MEKSMDNIIWTPGSIPAGSPAAMVPDPEGLVEKLSELEDQAMDLVSDLKEIKITMGLIIMYGVS